MERGASGGHHHTHAANLAAAAAAAAAAGHSYMTSSTDEYPGSKSSFDNPATKKKPPKLKAINRSLSMAIDNYDGIALPSGAGGGPSSGATSPSQLMFDEALIVEQPLIHRSASPIAAMRAMPPPQTLALPPTHHQMHSGGGGSGAVSPALSTRQQHHQQQQHLHTFQQLVARHHSQQQQQQHSSSTSSPTSHAMSPIPGGSGGQLHQSQHQPDIYLVSSSSLGDDVGVMRGGGGGGGSTSPIQFIDDYMLPHRHTAAVAAAAGVTHHPLRKTMFRRSDTIDVHPASTFQMKKTHSFHAQQPDSAAIDQLLLSASRVEQQQQSSSAASSRRTSSVRGNFLMPGHPAAGKDHSRSPSPSRRGCRSHRSFNDPTRRPSNKPDSVVESQIRHPSLNDDLMEPLDGRGALVAQANLSLENELFIESRSRSNSHTKMEDVGLSVDAQRVAAAAALARKSSGSFEDSGATGGVAGIASATHPPSGSSSMKKRDHPHSRQHSSHSLELDGRPSTSAAAAAAAAAVHGHPPHTLQLHSAAAAATAAYHFKRGAQHGRSLYLSPNNLEELQVHRPSVLAAAAAFQGTNASAKQAKALHSASMRLRTYREALSASKKSKSFIGDGAYPPPVAGNEFELTSPHRRNSRPMSTAVPGSGSGPGGAVTVEDIKRSPRPLAMAPTSSSAAAFIDEKRPSFERNPSLTYELSDAAFEQVLRPFHHKVAGRKASMSGSHKALKKKSLSDETDDDEEADRKRKRIVCIVMTVFLCLVCASVFVVILTLTHSSGSSQHQSSKKIYTFTRETPVHYNVRIENERLKESMERARFGKNFTDTASLISPPAAHMTAAAAASSTSAATASLTASASASASATSSLTSLSLTAHVQHQQQQHHQQQQFALLQQQQQPQLQQAQHVQQIP